MTARDDVRDELSWTPFAAQEAEYERLLDAYGAEVLAEYAAKIREDASLCIGGLADDCCQAYGVALARWLDQQAAALLRQHAAPQPDTTKET